MRTEKVTKVWGLSPPEEILRKRNGDVTPSIVPTSGKAPDPVVDVGGAPSGTKQNQGPGRTPGGDPRVRQFSSPREFFVVLDFISQCPNVAPTWAMETLRIGHSSWYKATEKLEAMGFVARCTTMEGKRNDRFQLTRRGAGARSAIEALMVGAESSPPSLAIRLEEGLARGHLPDVVDCGLQLERIRLLRHEAKLFGEVPGIFQALALGPVSPLLFSLERLARGDLDGALALRPQFLLPAPFHDALLIAPLKAFVRSRLSEAEGRLGESLEELKRITVRAEGRGASLLFADVLTSEGRLLQKGGNAREALKRAEAAAVAFQTLEDRLGEAEATTLKAVTLATAGDLRGAEETLSIAWDRAREAGTRTAICEILALRLVLVLATDRRAEGRQISAGLRRLECEMDWPRRARVQAMTTLALRLRDEGAAMGPEDLGKTLRLLLAGTP